MKRRAVMALLAVWLSAEAMIGWTYWDEAKPMMRQGYVWLWTHSPMTKGAPIPPRFLP
jgi:hypothetical protein